MCKVLILLFIIITFIKNPENAPNLLALDHHLPIRINGTIPAAVEYVIPIRATAAEAAPEFNDVPPLHEVH